MYNIRLDENKYYTGTYVSVGKVGGGIDIPTLPPDMEKSKFYKYDYHEVFITNLVADIDEMTGEQKIDAENNLLYIEEIVPIIELGWIFDEVKYNESLVLQLEIVKKNKTKELGLICEKNITDGTSIETTNGLEHFSFTDADQRDIKNAYDIAKITQISTLYHADNTPCRIFTVAEISSIYIYMQQLIAYNTTLCNMLNTWVRRCTTEDEINAISYTSSLPEDLQLTMDQNLAQAALVMNALIG